jgi:predicted MPP superfamily phosphohydrolase
MEETVLIVPDLHLRDVDITTVKGYCTASTEVLKDILKIIEDRHVTRLIFLGDICDKGYRNIHESFSHRNFMDEFNELTKRNVYTVLGNHFFLERDTNPEIYWIQPNDRYKPLKPIYAKYPILQTPEVLKVGSVQFSFHHFSKNNKYYIKRNETNAKYHCGLFHDDFVVPNSIRLEEGIRRAVDSSYMASIYRELDFAVIGHIHTPIGSRDIVVDGRTIPIDIPGSACVMSTKASDFHTDVNLPLYTITETGYKKEYVKLSLHTDLLNFKRKTSSNEANDLLDFDKTKEMLEGSLRTGSAMDYLISKGVNQIQIGMYSQAATGSLNSSVAVKLVTGGI